MHPLMVQSIANQVQFANYIVALTTPVFLASSSFGAYYFFTFSTLLCTVMCAIFMIETKGHSLEFIEQRYSEKYSTVTATGQWWRRGKRGIRLRNV